MAYGDILSLGVTPDDARRALSEIGFTDVMISSSRSALSGGWKMKLLIVRAMLCQADILLLDEVRLCYIATTVFTCFVRTNFVSIAYQSS